MLGKCFANLVKWWTCLKLRAESNFQRIEKIIKNGYFPPTLNGAVDKTLQYIMEERSTFIAENDTATVDLTRISDDVTISKNHVVQLKAHRTEIIGGTSSRSRVRQNTTRNTDMDKLNRLDEEIYTTNQLLKHKNGKNDEKEIADDCDAFTSYYSNIMLSLPFIFYQLKKKKSKKVKKRSKTT